MVFWTAKISPGARGLVKKLIFRGGFFHTFSLMWSPIDIFVFAQGGVTAARVNFSRVLEVSGQESSVCVCVCVPGRNSLNCRPYERGHFCHILVRTYLLRCLTSGFRLVEEDTYFYIFYFCTVAAQHPGLFIPGETHAHRLHLNFLLLHLHLFMLIYSYCI